MSSHAIYSVGSTNSVKVSPAGVHSGCDITIQNVNDTGYVYVGSTGVTTTNYGFRILPNHSISFELPGHDELYVIASSLSMNVAVMTTGLESGS